jgi:hypothetical protein
LAGLLDNDVKPAREAPRELSFLTMTVTLVVGSKARKESSSFGITASV